MIQAHELRIGNLVKYSEDGTIFEVGTIEENGLTVKNEYECTWIEIDQFEGIPLTEEWIRKFGFVFEDIGTDPTVEEIRYRKAVKGFGSDQFEIEFDIETRTVTLGNITGNVVEYQFVHQLQNVYFWNTFRELEIKDLTK